MGEGKLLAVAAALTAALVPALRAQGPVYRERWGFLHLEHRRAELLAALAPKDRAAHVRAAELLAGDDRGAPFAPVARATAQLRDASPDAAYLLRATIGAYVLPEVCDPEAKNEICRTTNVSLFLPYGVEPVGALTFELIVDDAGRTVWSTTVTQDTEMNDLRVGRSSAQVPCGDLPDGTYRVTVRTCIDGEGPRPGDPGLSWPFHVLRGYQERAERAFGLAREKSAALSPGERAVLVGLAAAVSRAYYGEAFAVASDGVDDLLLLERALANVDDGKAAAHGIAGDLSLALPTDGGPPLGCVLRRAGPEPRPLVVVVAGTPAYDSTLRRPSAPATRDPVWTAHELATFGAADAWHVAFVESPGGGRDFAAALRSALSLLRELAPAGDTLPLLVCEREAAAVVGLHVASFVPLVRGLVLIGSGAMTGPSLDGLGALPVRLSRVHGAAVDPLARVMDYVEHKRAAGAWQGDVAWLGERSPPWCIALPLLAGDVEAFARTLWKP